MAGALSDFLEFLLAIVFMFAVVAVLFGAIAILFYLFDRLRHAFVVRHVPEDAELARDRQLMETVSEEERRSLMVDAISGQMIRDENHGAKVAASSRLMYADINRHRQGTAVRVAVMALLAGLSIVTNESARWRLGAGLAFLIVWTVTSQVSLIRRKRRLTETAKVNGWDLDPAQHG